ncbi:hypothetical protein N7493_000228 [Penicillium malachiteum]|uniref:Uncharacterized protein n=1 Tax=Penicillium malachiteum TaxID=1324776 RepID=A0AAD6HVY2_9EURO|nr:hypothetical protein N7493_000228 [Penicillium malachiteum]
MPSDFLPAQTPQQTVSLWYKHLPRSLGQSELYDQALVALSLLVIAVSNGNGEFLTKIHQLYSKLSAKLADPHITEKLHPEHQIGIAMALNVYEFWHSAACREATFFSEPAWRKRSQDGDSYDELLDILLQIPTFSHNVSLYTSQYGSNIPKSLQDQITA